MQGAPRGRPSFPRALHLFDIGFSELVVIGLVALIVIGPERLPRVARTVGHLIGRLQRYVADVKSDINREVELEELRKMRDSVQQAAASLETSVTSGLSKTEEEINRSIAEVAPPAAEHASGSAAPESAQETAVLADKKP
jgi:sec-independent protein translocase protein TatB